MGISYPYLPSEGTISYVPADDTYMQAARAEARHNSLDDTMPTGSVVVKNERILGRGANGSDYHKLHGCERVKRNIPTGQGYELCEGCSPKNHSEPKAITDALLHDNDLHGATLYLWGHWWCCEPCWNAMLRVGITNVYVQEGSERLFNKDAVGNVVGKQFDTAV